MRLGGGFEMKLYHVSTINKDKKNLDLSIDPKQDIQFTGDLVYNVSSFERFYAEYNTPMISELARKRGWIKEKVATEAVFEYIRQKQYFYKPSRLLSTYFTNSLENAEIFNKREREGKAAIFTFDADSNNVFCFNMDLFHRACVSVESNGLKDDTFQYTKRLAEIYWQGYEGINNRDCEILYLGLPILKNIESERNSD